MNQPLPDPVPELNPVLATIENGLSPEMNEKFERIRQLARANRIEAAKRKRFRYRRPEQPPQKASRPFYYNPSERD